MNNRNTMNCGDILTCMECGKRFDEEESPHMFFCSDKCRGMFTLKSWREANIRRIEEQIQEDKE